MISVTPFILCGGLGTHLWPLSLTGFPKQFSCLTGKESLFQQAARWLPALCDSVMEFSPPLVVTGEDRFKVKRIQAKSEASLSLQKNHHRAEHWIVANGTAEITNGKNVLTLTENLATKAALGEVHRLSNPEAIPLEIIEGQSGSYWGEDDIVHIEDNYGRTEQALNSEIKKALKMPSLLG